MKTKFFKTLDDYNGLHSAVYASYIIAFSPIITILLGLLSWGLIGEYYPLGAMTRQVYLFAILFPILICWLRSRFWQMYHLIT